MQDAKLGLGLRDQWRRRDDAGASVTRARVDQIDPGPGREAAEQQHAGQRGVGQQMRDTWTQDLRRHVHVHALMACGALRCGGDVHSERQGDGGGHTSDGGAGAQGGGAGNGGDQCTWVKPARCQRFLFPVQALSKVFRGKFFDACPGSGLASCLLLAVPGAGVTAAAQTLLLASQPLKPTTTSVRASCHPDKPVAPQSNRAHPGGCIKAPNGCLARFEAAGLSPLRAVPAKNAASLANSCGFALAPTPLDSGGCQSRLGGCVGLGFLR